MATTQTLGIVSPVPRGDWRSDIQYNKLNIVRYNNSSYIAMVGNKGHLPTSYTTEWMLLNSDVKLPTVSTSDNGKFLRVNSSGQWVATTVDSAEGKTF